MNTAWRYPVGGVGLGLPAAGRNHISCHILSIGIVWNSIVVFQSILMHIVNN